MSVYRQLSVYTLRQYDCYSSSDPGAEVDTRRVVPNTILIVIINSIYPRI